MSVRPGFFFFFWDHVQQDLPSMFSRPGLGHGVCRLCRWYWLGRTQCASHLVALATMLEPKLAYLQPIDKYQKRGGFF